MPKIKPKQTKIKIQFIKSADGTACKLLKVTSKRTKSEPIDVSEAKAIVDKQGMKQEDKTTIDGKIIYTYS